MFLPSVHLHSGCLELVLVQFPKCSHPYILILKNACIQITPQLGVTTTLTRIKKRPSAGGFSALKVVLGRPLPRTPLYPKQSESPRLCRFSEPFPQASVASAFFRSDSSPQVRFCSGEASSVTVVPTVCIVRPIEKSSHRALQGFRGSPYKSVSQGMGERPIVTGEMILTEDTPRNSQVAYVEWEPGNPTWSSSISFITLSSDTRSNQQTSLYSLVFHKCLRILCIESLNSFLL
ncbi:uncharacterized protein LOC119470066 [Cebus imitator]|uniref:uncharacterized protein LOC119470066 n=1 Tax=Cebus imitator TaxID=2715852 RepID=UPI001898F7E1|nr:uncharacterized protein LOC119470066 [Cebus imitator]